MKNFLALVLLAGLGYATAALALSESLGLVQSFAQTATTTATRVAPTAWARQMKSCKIGNPSATPIYLGGSDLTAANGFPICNDTAACASASLPADILGGEIWVITSSGTQAFRTICGG